MNNQVKGSTNQAATAFPRERAQFKALLLANPNYFGNLANAAQKPVLAIAGNIFYEELACVGYHPQQEKLEAVVYLFRSNGYGSGVCGPGTPEFVRFYLSYDNGVSWQDQGLASFQAHDIPGAENVKRLEYAVSLPISPIRKFCTQNQLPRVRAILSWNNPPPANQPNWTPIWGNVRDASIFVEPFRFIFPHDLFEIAEVKFPPLLKEIIDVETKIQTTLKSLTVGDLAALYKGQDVPAHRFAFKELTQAITGFATLSPAEMSSLLPGIKLDPGIVDVLFPKTDGNTSFEELVCIGLDPNQPDTLVGVIQVKKPSGFSGGPCTQGSREYVTFWGDFDGNGSFETCLGTANVQVYDVQNIPPGGIFYAVRLPVDLNKYRQPCQKGAKLVHIRAILSWNAPAACANPNLVPAWGNREETTICIGPGVGGVSGKIAILGGIAVSHIDNTTGLTDSTAVFATNNTPPDSSGRPCPFGGRVTAQGAPVANHSYIVEVSRDGFLWTPLLTDLVVTDLNGVTSTHKANPATKRFDYLPFNQNINSLLAHFDSGGDDRWMVRLSVYDAVGNLQGTDTHLVQLDNTGPLASIEITTGSGNCGKFSINTLLNGNFVATDLYLAGYSLAVEPAVNPSGVGVPSPAAGFANTASAPGNGWSLDTKNMKPCGYVIRVVASDRAILNSQSVGHVSSDSAGFCLE